MRAADARLSPRQRGDFQTPEELARKIWATIDYRQFDLIIEPTFGLGSFLTTMPADCAAPVLGWEIESQCVQAARERLGRQQPLREFRLFHRDVFTVKASDIPASAQSRVLVIGNPPWVTNAEQGLLGGKNTGKKSNLKSLNGLEALTGKSNFDISEAIIFHFVNLLKTCRLAQFALLAKFTVLRNILKLAGQWPRAGGFEFHIIDSSKYFNASVEAGLIRFKVGADVFSNTACPIYEAIAGKKVGELHVSNDKLVYDVDGYRRASFVEHKGPRHYVWRQGVKHDLKNILQLVESKEGLRNGLGEVLDIEPETLYHFYKSSDIFHGRKPRFLVPIYQRDLKDDLSDLPKRYPKLYAYLARHEAKFLARKSSVYKNRNPFAVFGIGDYTHSVYKVAIAGLYDKPVFRLLEPCPRPVVVDDTAYMLSTDSYEEAVYLLAVLSLNCASDFLLSISHSGDKRRFSKDALARILIPPADDCPRSIISALVEARSSKQVFPESVKRALRVWLSRLSGRL